MSTEAAHTSLSQFGQPLATSCTNGGCPTIYPPDSDDIVIIQGYSFSGPTDVPAGEGLVRVPAQLIRDAYLAMSD